MWSERGPLPELTLEAKRESAPDLLDGPHVLRGDLERACDALDASGLERAFSTLKARFELPAWADDVHRASALLRSFEGLAPREVLERHVRGDDDGFLRRRVRLAAVRRAMRRVLETDGPAATLASGSPVAGLASLLNDAELATTLMSDACDAAPTNVAWWVSLAKHGGDAAALRAWCRALLLAPDLGDDAVNDSKLAVQLFDEAEELDEPAPWLSVLADLKHVLLLDDFVFSFPETHAVHGVARALRSFRVERAALSEAQRLERKRALLRACPGLKALWRAL